MNTAARLGFSSCLTNVRQREKPRRAGLFTHVDVRTLSNSLRAMFTDARSQQIVPLGNSNSLPITAPASMMTTVVEMLARVDEEAGRTVPSALPAKPAEQPATPK